MSENLAIKNQRNSAVELLRMFFMLCIVVSHGMGHGSGLNYELIYSWGGEIDSFMHLTIFSLGKIGVTGFMFISGYYGIRFKKRGFITLLAICAFYILILSRGSDLLSLLKPYSRWWFIESYILVYVLSPAIELMFNNLSKKQVTFIVLALAYYSYVGRFLSFENSHDTVMLLTIYIIARYIGVYVNGGGNSSNTSLPNRLYQLWVSRIGLYALLLCVSFIPVLMNLVGLPFKFFRLWFQNNNILYLLLAAVMVVRADKRPFYSKAINWLSGSVLAIYLITDSDWLRLHIDTWLYGEILAYRGYLYAVLLCLACMLVDKVREVLFKLIEKPFKQS